MTRLPVSATIITLNEERNIARAIRSLAWVDDVIVVDSGSTDRTCEIAKELGARVVRQPWLGYGQQKNYAQSHAKYDWVINVDADEEVSDELGRELRVQLERVLSGQSGVAGFSFPRKTYYLGRWIRHGGWYPNILTRVADRRKGRWSEPQVHEKLEVDGEVRTLSAPLHHYTFSNIEDQVLTNLRYSRFGSQELTRRGMTPSLLRLLVKPIGKFGETYFLKKGFLDGLPGLIISINAAHSMFLKYAYLFEAELNRENPHH